MSRALVLGGATGLLGQSLMAALLRKGWDALPLGRQDGDVLDPEFLKSRIATINPDVVFNAIAWTKVDDAEDHPQEAMRLNRGLPDSLARILSVRENTRLVHFSTDFVFSGMHQGYCKEEEEPNPISVYGQTKLEGERAVAKILPARSCVIRTAWLFGPGRKNFVDTILRACKQRDQVNVVDDQFGSPTYTPDLAEWSVALAEGGATGIWHGVNSGHASWCEFASEAIHLVSGPCRIAPITSGEWPQKAKRPFNSALDNRKLAAFLGYTPRPWPKALREYLFNVGMDGSNC